MVEEHSFVISVIWIAANSTCFDVVPQTTFWIEILLSKHYYEKTKGWVVWIKLQQKHNMERLNIVNCLFIWFHKPFGCLSFTIYFQSPWGNFISITSLPILIYLSPRAASPRLYVLKHPHRQTVSRIWFEFHGWLMITGYFICLHSVDERLASNKIE